MDQKLVEKVEDDRVYLNVGGTSFVTTAYTLRSIPDTLLSSLDKSSEYYDPQKKAYFFDRDPHIFGHILNLYRWGELHFPSNICPIGFRKEMEFWGIQRDRIAPCCWKVFYQVDEHLETLEKLNKAAKIREYNRQNDQTTSSYERIKRSVWYFLDNPDSSRSATIWFYSYMSVVFLSALVYMLWMLPSLRVQPYISPGRRIHNHSHSKAQIMVNTDPHPLLFFLDLLCMIVFVFELVLHFAMCPWKCRFFLDWYNALKLLLIVIMCISLIFEIRKDLISSFNLALMYYIFKNFNILRLVMLVKLEKKFTGLRVLLQAMRASQKELLLLAVSFMMCTVIFAGLIFCSEMHVDTFNDIFIALWWAIVTMTTVGYGDYYPVDTVGRIVASLCAMCGVLILAMPITVIASNFALFYGRNSDQERHFAAVVQNKIQKHSFPKGTLEHNIPRPDKNKISPGPSALKGITVLSSALGPSRDRGVSD